MEVLVTVEEAAQILKCKRTTIFRLLAEGKLRRGLKFGKRTVIQADSVHALLESAVTPESKKRGRPRIKRAIPRVEPEPDYRQEILSLIQ